MHPVELPSPIHIKPHSQPTSSMPHTHRHIAHTYTYTHFDVQNKRDESSEQNKQNTLKRTKKS